MSVSEAWIGDCHLKEIDGQRECCCQVAVWADGFDVFHARLEEHLQAQGLSLLWVEEGLSAPHYLRRHRDQQSRIGVLARAVHAGHPVEFGPLNFHNVGVGLDTEQNYLVYEDIADTAPLDDQFGAWPVKNVPKMLLDPLFGQPEPDSSAIEDDGDVAQVPVMRTYAVIDAAKLQSGFDEIAECGLRYRCLFKGQAAQDLKDVAPLLLELDPSADMTRRLLTYNPKLPESMTTAHLWHKEPGIYIRSRMGFEDIWRHFRKFVRIQDESGKWFYFRFWEPSVLNQLPAILTPENGKQFFAKDLTFVALTANPNAGRIIRRV
ncbi:hypothetical protein TH25_23715 [Thalassospira profundimaris]|uniref:DUF4123 domain-containing protein n=1 Tax=Thalassospira profundimaris TaxID=502049 RepID=A0A367WJ37_9PROT|nr:DUF4123 domain-containing protein [Thalassospira profundimaris]RCK41437.1 hypothetical protein TH25_23715 [Thalassospira profundimaris]